MSGDPAAVRVYGALTRLYPRRFRDEYGDDMVSLFRDQYHDEPAWRVLPRTVVDLAITIPTQHLETTMRRPSSPLVPIIYLAIALAGVLLAIVGGSNATTAIIGLTVAVGSGATAVIAWQRGTPVRGSGTTGHWWQFVLAGPLLIGLVVVAAELGVEAWFLGIATVLTGLVVTAIGVVLGCAHLLHHRIRRIPT